MADVHPNRFLPLTYRSSANRIPWAVQCLSGPHLSSLESSLTPGVGVSRPVRKQKYDGDVQDSEIQTMKTRIIKSRVSVTCFSSPIRRATYLAFMQALCQFFWFSYDVIETLDFLGQIHPEHALVTPTAGCFRHEEKAGIPRL